MNPSGNVGVGEREGRVICDLVRRRHFGLTHGGLLMLGGVEQTSSIDFLSTELIASPKKVVGVGVGMLRGAWDSLT